MICGNVDWRWIVHRPAVGVEKKVWCIYGGGLSDWSSFGHADLSEWVALRFVLLPPVLHILVQIKLIYIIQHQVAFLLIAGKIFRLGREGMAFSAFSFKNVLTSLPKFHLYRSQVAIYYKPRFQALRCVFDRNDAHLRRAIQTAKARTFGPHHRLPAVLLVI